MHIFNFRDGHVTTFCHPSGAYICQMPGHRDLAVLGPKTCFEVKTDNGQGLAINERELTTII